jgi:hypothetical protein
MVFVDLIALSGPDNGVVQAPTVEAVMSLEHVPGQPWKARPTVYAGIQMRSRLEATFAEMTDSIGVMWEYEPRAYGAKGRRQYLPDFEIWLRDGKYRYYVEVRPTPEMGYLAMERMTVIWESEPDAGLIVTTPHGPSWVAHSDERAWELIDLPWGWRD